jgi:hypothetical protein
MKGSEEVLMQRWMLFLASSSRPRKNLKPEYVYCARVSIDYTKNGAWVLIIADLECMPQTTPDASIAVGRTEIVLGSTMDR